MQRRGAAAKQAMKARKHDNPIVSSKWKIWRQILMLNQAVEVPQASSTYTLGKLNRCCLVHRLNQSTSLGNACTTGSCRQQMPENPVGFSGWSQLKGSSWVCAQQHKLVKLFLEDSYTYRNQVHLTKTAAVWGLKGSAEAPGWALRFLYGTGSSKT